LQIGVDQLSFVGRELKRPECVLCMPSGRLYVADRNGGILRIEPDGKQALLKWQLPSGVHDFIPNGFALLPDGTFLVANMGHDGGVWARRPDGQVEPYLMEADGERLAKANFVFNDEQGRVWITVTTRSDPLSKAMTGLGQPELRDGFVCLVDSKGGRIVADGFAFTNEARIDSSGKGFYVVETQGRRITRFRLGSNGDLSGRETFTTFGHGTFADGMAFDAEGHLWVTSIVSNRLWRVAPDGKATLEFEDGNAEHIAEVERVLTDRSIRREHFYMKSGARVQNVASIAFGGPDLRTAYLGSLSGDTIAAFRSPAAGLPLPHWTYGDHNVGA
jgi:sugar lactone lactonase YvrE